MLRYFLMRIAGLIGVLLVVTFIAFFLARAVPGGPYEEIQKPLSPDAKANIMRKYGMDKPFYVQWFNYVVGAVQGDFGTSLRHPNKTIPQLLGERWWASLLLGGLALLWSIPLGLLLGVIAAVKRNSWIDSIVTLLSIVGTTVPLFALGLFGLYVFSIVLKWVPYPASAEGWQPWKTPSILVLPVLIWGLQPLGIIARYTRSNLLEVMGSDYVRTAKAKGLAPDVVLFKHALRNSLIPVITVLGPIIPNALTGSSILERQFLIPGIGNFFIESITFRNYPLITGMVIIIAVMWGISYLLSDFAYSFADPRVRIGGRK
jgi:ABC-type dipeptide/oligopeptide/nickel transport system permease component